MPSWSGPPKADILFIIDVDDDPQEETDIINSVPTFMTAAANIDFRIAVTTRTMTTPPRPPRNSGRLMPCPTCSTKGPSPIIISPSTACRPVERELIRARPSKNLISERERQLGPAPDWNAERRALLHGALQRPAAWAAAGDRLLRPGRLLAATAITDNGGDNEADSSALAKGNHNPTWYANFFETYFQKSVPSSPGDYINPTPDRQCGHGLLELPPAAAEATKQMISATNGFALNTLGQQLGHCPHVGVDFSHHGPHLPYPLVGSPSEGQGTASS